MPCLTCKHWDAKRTPPEMRRVGLAVCALGPRWEFLPPHVSCARFVEAPTEIAAARVEWHARRTKRGPNEP